MIFMLRYLSERDSLGIVEYGSEVKVSAPLTRCDQEGLQKLRDAVEKIQISGLVWGGKVWCCFFVYVLLGGFDSRLGLA